MGEGTWRTAVAKCHRRIPVGGHVPRSVPTPGRRKRGGGSRVITRVETNGNLVSPANGAPHSFKISKKVEPFRFSLLIAVLCFLFALSKETMEPHKPRKRDDVM
ncbi:hypothetical protein HPP92_016730 [Vanilla planifolia]|uniref:Transmembrane protein n=1 Tax=Vanilla planifolia TaxID=51239 RepID=A0A835US15_VANPL|nr:hypothetical protein HPP92_017230 [Vanilla planifolia]KAG0472184.1 hypothetical protein HPP92_016730 [Vanilla planifolia]